MKQVVMLVAVLAFAPAAAGQNADDYRGGWRTDSGEAHTYEFSIRGAHGQRHLLHLLRRCDDAGVRRWDVRPGRDHVRGHPREGGRQHGVQGQGDREVQPGPPDRDRHERRARRRHVRARADQGSARTGSDSGDGVGAPEGSSVRCRRTQPRRNPDGADGLPYIQPGPWKSTLTEKDVIGVWLGFGVGAPKQFFIIKKVGDKLRGMVCGTCDNPYTMAALDDFQHRGRHAEVQHPPRGLGRRRDPDVLQARHRARRLERDAVHDGRRPPAAATAAPPAWPCPGILAAGADSDRGDTRQRLARMAAEEHVVAAIAPPTRGRGRKPSKQKLFV